MNEQHTEGAEIPSSRNTESAATEAERPTPEALGKAGEVQREIHGTKWILTVGAILSCVFLFALDTTVVCSRLLPTEVPKLTYKPRSLIYSQISSNPSAISKSFRGSPQPMHSQPHPWSLYSLSFTGYSTSNGFTSDLSSYLRSEAPSRVLPRR